MVLKKKYFFLEHIRYFSEAYDLFSACVYGGADKKP